MNNTNLYAINYNQVKCINILIAILDEAIKRKAFSIKEIEKIDKTIEIICIKN
tara:strand:+ start:895 stop:1053 length:159 start_codon:yes stop_codon:yes gene_type:complete